MTQEVASLNPPKKKNTVSVVDESGHLWSEKPHSPEKLYRGEISKNGKRFFTSDEKLFLFDGVCRHHGFDPHEKEDTDTVRESVTYSLMVELAVSIVHVSGFQIF